MFSEVTFTTYKRWYDSEILIIAHAYPLFYDKKGGNYSGIKERMLISYERFKTHPLL